MAAPYITSTMTTSESTSVLLDHLQRVPCALVALGWCRTAARQRNESGATLAEKNDGAPTSEEKIQRKPKVYHYFDRDR